MAAEHIGADAIIHFGRSCLSPSRRLPVLYIFTQIPVNVSAVIAGLQTAIEDHTRHLVLLYDTRCHYAAGKLNTNSVVPSFIILLFTGTY